MTQELIKAADGSLDLIRTLAEADATTPVRLDLARVFEGRDLEDDETFELYEAFGRFFGLIHRSAKWWLADWLNFGEGAFGHRFEQAITATGLSEGYLRNIMWVGANVPPSRRVEHVAFSIHETVAPLPPEGQKRWLREAKRAQAAGTPITQRELRAMIREADGKQQSLPVDDGDERNDTAPLSANVILEKAHLVAAWATRDGDHYIVPAEAFVQLLAAIGKGE